MRPTKNELENRRRAALAAYSPVKDILTVLEGAVARNVCESSDKPHTRAGVLALNKMIRAGNILKLALAHEITTTTKALERKDTP